MRVYVSVCVYLTGHVICAGVWVCDIWLIGQIHIMDMTLIGNKVQIPHNSTIRPHTIVYSFNVDL